jgi:hypothetical protein
MGGVVIYGPRFGRFATALRAEQSVRGGSPENRRVSAKKPGKGLGAAMGLKEKGQTWTIKEQVIEDLATGLTLKFEVVPDDLEAPFRLKIVGDLPFGDREIMFGPDGQEACSSMAVPSFFNPSWLTSADEYRATD